MYFTVRYNASELKVGHISCLFQHQCLEEGGTKYAPIQCGEYILEKYRTTHAGYSGKSGDATSEETAVATPGM